MKFSKVRSVIRNPIIIYYALIVCVFAPETGFYTWGANGAAVSHEQVVIY